jgi:membrane protein DedA with SNARE-associated domain
VPVIRSFISIPAGIAEMPLGRYAVLTMLGTIPWCFGLAGAGYALGESWESFHDSSRFADYVLAALLVGGIAYLLLRARRRRLRRRAIGATDRAR